MPRRGDVRDPGDVGEGRDQARRVRERDAVGQRSPRAQAQREAGRGEGNAPRVDAHDRGARHLDALTATLHDELVGVDLEVGLRRAADEPRDARRHGGAEEEELDHVEGEERRVRGEHERREQQQEVEP